MNLMEMALALALLIGLILAGVTVATLIRIAPADYRFHAASAVMILVGALALPLVGWPFLWAVAIAIGGITFVAFLAILHWMVVRWVQPWADEKLGQPTGPGYCPQCHYDLRGNPDATRCPECGADLSEHHEQV